MKRMAHVIYLKPSAKIEYLKIHSDVWPEILEIIALANISNYSIFLKEPEDILFSYWEYLGSDFEADIANLGTKPAMQKWWAITDKMQSSFQTSDADQHWAPMKEVFHTDHAQTDTNHER